MTSSLRKRGRNATRLRGFERPRNKRVRVFKLTAPSLFSFVHKPELPYTWKQELGELDIIVPVPKGTRGRDLNVVIGKNRLSVGLKGNPNILEGELCKEIKVEDSTWTLRSYLLLSLTTFYYIAQSVFFS
jgi:hypothetical protein